MKIYICHKKIYVHISDIDFLLFLGYNSYNGIGYKMTEYYMRRIKT